MSQRVVIVVRQAGLGQVAPGDELFGIEMFDLFLHTLESGETRPEAICFYTEGVKLACEGSPVIASLQLIQGLGVRLVLCGTCLQHFGLEDRVAVGGVGSMKAIVNLLMGADHVITV